MEMTKKLVRTGIAAVVALACAVALTFSLAACGGKSDEEQIKEVLTTEFDSFKNIGDEAKQIFKDSGGSSLEAMGINADDFLNGWLKDFDYSIGDITVNGDKAEAKVSVTAKKLMDAINGFVTSFQEWAATATGLSEDDYMKKGGEMVMDSINKQQAATSEITVTLEKKDGKWAVDSAGEAAVIEAVVGDTSSLGM